MAAKTYYLSNALLNAILKATGSIPAPSPIYVALNTSASSPGTPGTEVSDGNYNRQPNAFGAWAYPGSTSYVENTGERSISSALSAPAVGPSWNWRSTTRRPAATSCGTGPSLPRSPFRVVTRSRSRTGPGCYCTRTA